MISHLLPSRHLEPLPPPGLHAFEHQKGSDRSRIHLRVSEDGGGLLLVNASRVLHLNPTAAAMAWLFLRGESLRGAVGKLCKVFRVPPGLAEADYLDLTEKIQRFALPDGPCPIHELDFEVLAPFSQPVQAPYRMDLALTYRCNANCAHCYNARPRNYPELDRAAWVLILDRLWEIGVPHICFTGGEATLRKDLPDLIAHAHGLGQIVGLLTNGRRLSDARLVENLVQAGLDHVQITVESSDATVHDRMLAAAGAWGETVAGIRNALESSLFVMTNTTLLRENAGGIGSTIDWLAELGVPTVGCNALIHAGKGANYSSGLAEHELGDVLDQVRARTAANGQRLIWYTPTQYCSFDPVQFELGVKGCTAAQYNMCVEPDGAVIPCQSYYQALGNLVTDSWDSIWNHKIAVGLRNRDYLPHRCLGCPVVAECSGGCPLALRSEPVGLSIGAV